MGSSQLAEEPGDFRRVIQDADREAEAEELVQSSGLKRPGLFARGLDLHETDAAPRQEHQPVRHPVHARGHQLRAEASPLPNSIHQFLFNEFLSHGLYTSLLFAPF